MADKREILQQLYDEIERAEATNQPSAAVLADLRTRLREALDQEDDADHEPLVERLNDSVYELEADHPRLAAAMKVVIDTLSNLGI